MSFGMKNKNLKFFNKLSLMGVLFLFWMFSCHLEQEEAQKNDTAFFKLGDLIDDQSSRLSENKALLYKKLTLMMITVINC
jgi:hypothetical protein